MFVLGICLDATQTLGQRLVIHVRGGLIVGIHGIGIAERLGACTLLIHIGAAHQLGTEIEILSLGLLQIGDHLQYRTVSRINAKFISV